MKTVDKCLHGISFLLWDSIRSIRLTVCLHSASPRFKKIEVKVRGGKVFTVEAPNNSKDNIYIQKVYLNGKPYHKSYITYDDIINGSTLKFEMGKKPAKNFGKASANRPIVLNK